MYVESMAVLSRDALTQHPHLQELLENPEMFNPFPEGMRMGIYGEAMKAINEIRPDFDPHEPVVKLRQDNRSLWLVVRMNPLERPCLMGQRPSSAEDSFIIPDDRPLNERIIVDSDARQGTIYGCVPELAANIGRLRRCAWNGEEDDVKRYVVKLTDAVMNIRRTLVSMDRANEFSRGVAGS